MESLQTYFDQQPSRDIQTLARYVQQYVNQNWQPVLQANKAEMIRRYPEIGDTVYGLYGKRLFDPVHEQFKLVGLRATPRLPGNLMISREWGEEDDRQRWMWSRITQADGTALGTLVVIFYHNHIEIDVPRAFQIVALEESTPKAIIAALSKRSPDFANAMDMKAEIAQYMAQG